MDNPVRVYEDGPCEVTRLRYAANGAHVYIEVLAIKDPSSARDVRFVIHRYCTRATPKPGHEIWEFISEESALEAWENFRRTLNLDWKSQFLDVQGFVAYWQDSPEMGTWFMRGTIRSVS